MSSASWVAIAVVLFTITVLVAEKATGIHDPNRTTGVHDTAPAGQTSFTRTGSRFQESRPSVQDGDDVQYAVDKDGRQIVNTESAALAVDDQTSGNASSFIRTGALFESRPRRSVDEGDDVGYLVDNHGRQYVRAEISEPLTAFGEVAVAELFPLVQLQFPYSVNPRL